MTKAKNQKCTKCMSLKPLDKYSYRNKVKNIRHKICKDCHRGVAQSHYFNNKERYLIRFRTWGEENREASNRIKTRYNQKDGWGVYKATYASGIYIGSGQLQVRKNQHLSGNNHLEGKATKFEVLLRCLRKDCRMYENQIIVHYGLDNLLNNRLAMRIEDE